MPYPYAKKLLVWPTYCEIINISHQITVSASGDENCFIQVMMGKAVVHHNGADYAVGTDAVVVLGRSFAVSIENVPEHPCQVLLLRLENTSDSPGVDLNHLCLTMPIIDTFFSIKTRFCILTDREYIRTSLTSIMYEMQHKDQERENMLQLMLEEFFIKLARSFNKHKRPTSVQFVNRARECIRRRFQQNLTVEEIAAYAGISRSYLVRLFATHMGCSPVEYMQVVRCDHAAYLLRTTRFPVVDIALESGFNSRQHFARTFGKIYGVTPRQYRAEYRMD